MFTYHPIRETVGNHSCLYDSLTFCLKELAVAPSGPSDVPVVAAPGSVLGRKFSLVRSGLAHNGVIGNPTSKGTNPKGTNLKSLIGHAGFEGFSLAQPYVWLVGMVGRLKQRTEHVRNYAT